MFIVTLLFFILDKERTIDIKRDRMLDIQKDILNKPWNYYIYKYRDTLHSGFNVIQKRNLNRYAIFLQNGVFENVFFSVEKRSYMKTFGTWIINDSTLKISFKRDSEWRYLGNTDSVRIVGDIQRFSKECFILVTVKRSEGKRYNGFFFKSQIINSPISKK
jgi:hypothetical protein